MKGNIFIFIAISLLLHAVLFFKTAQQDIVLPENYGNTISIIISENKVIASPHKEQKKTAQIKTKKTKVHTKKQLIFTNKQNKLTKTEEITSRNPSKEIEKTNYHTKIISVLRDKLKQHFYYPKIAQRKNWQGKVLLVFDVNAHGLIKNITVRKSSGYSILDDAAKNSLTRVTTIPQQWIKAEYFSNLKLTVKYHLEDS